MRKSWFMGVLIVVGVVAVFIAFNYQGGKDAVPLSEIFPDEEVFPVEAEYEFVGEETLSRETGKVLPGEQETRTEAQVETAESSLVAVDDAPADKAFVYTVQIASFKDEKKAEEALKKIRAKVPSAYIGSRDLGKKGVWYRIYAGRFELRSEAEVTLSDIRQNYDDSFIISPKRTR